MNIYLPYRASIFLVGLLSCLIILCCKQNENKAPSGESSWLSGTADERFEKVARQLRGFDMAMVETGHRYNELYWAGQDKNWGYAKYQVQKIRLAVENGLERRPKRAASAETFLKIVVPEVEKAIDSRNPDLFWNRFQTLTSTCNSCHEAEKVEFVVVRPPEIRTSPVKSSGTGRE